MATLYVVATPIGNLSDITFRAVETLKIVDFVLAEDTRHSAKIFSRYDIQTKLVPFHSHTSEGRLKKIVEEVKNAESVALVSDAGTPLVSDPGVLFVSALIKEGIDVVPIPGPSAVISALSVSGFPSHQFTFYGFIPHKKKRVTILREIAASPKTAIFYESPHRILKTLAQLVDYCEETRQVVIGREMTKKFEEYLRGTVHDVSEELAKRDKVKGEITVVLSPCSNKKPC
ncbi:16S rRNA (cytidine(1402)-2'-O)-methyltransferase [Patescibacteria group bacterium]|nr:16S rRNA (cytidine(1402)-2'-O)-methyltransferase [Patescibacteria group bacterium]